jgi:TetR/AcrR family transcriptional repressor of uid operon
MARQARAEMTRSTIIRAAADLFDRYGYGATSLGDIIAHAGVTKGSLYFHFSSKEDLAHAVVQEQHAIWTEHARSFVDGDPALEALIRMSFSLSTQLVEHPLVRGGIRLTLEHGTFQRPLPDPYLDWILIVTGLLERATAERDVRTSVELDRFAKFIVSSFTGLQLVAQVLNERRNLPDRMVDLWQIVLPGLVLSKRLHYYLNYVVAVRKELSDG